MNKEIEVNSQPESSKREDRKFTCKKMYVEYEP